MNLPFRPPKKKIQATMARRPREADFTEEPNVRWSSAFVVALVLHIVAVGGIYAFAAINMHQMPVFEETDSTPTPAPAQAVASTQTESDVTPAPAASPAAMTYYRVKSGDTIARIAAAYGVGAEEVINLNNLRELGGIHVGQELTIPAAGGDQASPAVRDSGNTYTVVHGDTMVSIARKLHVLYDDLIRLNKIEDPKKLKIGLKLKVPVKRTVTA